jgi:hypothetical protein
MRRDPEARLRYAARNELKAIESFLREEKETAITIMEWCRIRHEDLSDDAYRAVAFLRNEEYLARKGSVTLLYQTRRRLDRELPRSTKETAMDLARYRFAVYAAVLGKGGYL